TGGQSRQHRQQNSDKDAMMKTTSWFTRATIAGTLALGLGIALRAAPTSPQAQQPPPQQPQQPARGGGGRGRGGAPPAGQAPAAPAVPHGSGRPPVDAALADR